MLDEEPRRHRDRGEGADGAAGRGLLLGGARRTGGGYGMLELGLVEHGEGMLGEPGPRSGADRDQGNDDLRPLLAGTDRAAALLPHRRGGQTGGGGPLRSDERHVLRAVAGAAGGDGQPLGPVSAGT